MVLSSHTRSSRRTRHSRRTRAWQRECRWTFDVAERELRVDRRIWNRATSEVNVILSTCIRNVEFFRWSGNRKDANRRTELSFHCLKSTANRRNVAFFRRRGDRKAVIRCTEDSFHLVESSFNLIPFKSFQCILKSSLIVEYSRMNAPSLSSGCEIAPFLFAIPVVDSSVAVHRIGRVRCVRSGRAH